MDSGWRSENANIVLEPGKLSTSKVGHQASVSY